MDREQTTEMVPITDQALLPVDAAGFTTSGGFMLLQRGAQLLASSTLLPTTYHGNVANCAIVLELAQRLQASPIMVAQNLYIVSGRPGWSSQFLIASVNQCGRFTALQWEWFGDEGTDGWGCRAVAKELRTGNRVQGPAVTLGIAKAEGWYGRNGSKWKTMPELMLTYRAATFFARTHAPELTMGLPTREEVYDTIDAEAVDTETGEIVGRKAKLVQMPRAKVKPAEAPTEPTVSESAPTETSGGAIESSSTGAAVGADAPASAPVQEAKTEPATNGNGKPLPKPLDYKQGQAVKVLRVWKPNPARRGHLVETSAGLACAYDTPVLEALEHACKGNLPVRFEGALIAYPDAPFKILTVILDSQSTAAAGLPSMPAVGEVFGNGEREPGDERF